MARPRDIFKVLPKLGRLIRRFAPFIRPYRALLGGSFAALFGTVGARLLEPWPLKLVFDGVIVVGAGALAGEGVEASGILGPLASLDPGTLLLASCIAVVAIATLRGVMQYASTVGFALLGNRVLTEVRAVMYEHLQRLPLSYHTKARGGDLTIRVIGDVGMLKEIVVTAFLPMLGNVVILLGMLAVMFWMNASLALVAVAIFPLFWLVSQRQGKRIHTASRAQREREGAMAATAAESIGAIKLVQSLSLEATFAKSFANANAKSLKDGVKIKRMTAALERTVDVLIAVATALVLWFGARLVLSSTLTPGDLLVFVTYLKNAFKPMRDFAKYTARLAKAAAAGERVMEVLDADLTVRDRPGAVDAHGARGTLRFDGVGFAYDAATPVLDDVSLEVPAGTSVAFVGPSGAGKSTVAGLVSRLYDPTLGSIRLDDRDLRDYRLRSLRSQISVVLQENVLFGGTIRDNIAVGVPDADEGAIRRAAQVAHAHEFIAALPDGYETIVGERGATLSGGQRQRIAVARAALRRTPVLLLDEPTAGLDEANERLVIESLLHVARGRTTVLITHDLAFAASADRIVYLEGGRVVERGAPDELLARGGRFATTYRLQQREREVGVGPGGEAPAEQVEASS